MIEANVQSTTKERILDAAETLFAEHGFEATSLRMITGAAGVNLAAVNYHFHSKEALVEAVFSRRIGPINQERLRLLEICEKAAGEGPPPIEELFRAFVEPPLRMRGNPACHGADVGRIFGRLYSDPSESARRSFFGLMRPIMGPFISAFRRALPEMPLVELLWRLHFAVGMMAHTLAGTYHLQAMSGGLCDPSDVEGIIERMVAFAAAGMRAPLPPTLHRS
jgi:AcrR family transcriptional regulator